MKEPINVLVTLPLDIALVEQIRRVNEQINVISAPATDDETGTIPYEDADVLYTGSALPSPDQAARLGWVQVHWAGIDHILDHPLYAETAIQFTNASGIHAPQMGQYILAMMLAFANKVPQLVRDGAEGQWSEGRSPRYMGTELRNLTLGIIGYGSIGRETARLASAFGMRVLAVKRNARQPAQVGRYHLPDTGDPEGEIPDVIYPPQAVLSFVSECDVVVITLPLNSETRNAFDGELFNAMKSNAVLINVARGDVLDEEALVSALENNVIGGAALDVYQEEPLPPGNKLWSLPNVILSPHIAGHSPHYRKRAVDLFCENLRRYLANEDLLNLVERERGY